MDTSNPTTRLPQTPLGSPFGPGPEQPRLGIIHLMVWIACVAVQFSVARVFSLPDWELRFDLSLVIAAMVEIGRATALGGLLLLAARRYRRLPFPRHPGEWLLVLLGVGASIDMVLAGMRYATVHAQAVPTLLGYGVAILSFVLPVVLYCLAARRARVLRWRVYFVTALALLLLPFITRLAFVAVNEVVLIPPLVVEWLDLLLLLPLVPVAFLLFVAAKDARQVPRYPWTHWLGIGVGLWIGAWQCVGRLYLFLFLMP